MNTELVVASVSGGVALLSALISVRASRRQVLLSAELDRRDVMSRRRDPLLWAAFDLQSRLHNIVERGFLPFCYQDETGRDREYARRSTLHVLGEYLGQVEILRRRIQFLDLGRRRHNRAVVERFTAIATVLNEDGGYDDRHFRIFRSDQRALGEIMIKEDGESCLGYAEFCRRLEGEPEFAAWFQPLLESLDEQARSPEPHRRLRDLQLALVELIDLLDPNGDQFPERPRVR
ncbi:hypothetical protein [Streptomyces sp. TLI_185]|uniref:hypothetical protein n=1 Tax=Streptomyces sp. TLI_185 TaxID=2485151 RepID=UPI000F4EADDF|nr:hypothetical protein [Streptomyces sp. TLI_185]RPF33217.1 hypothetical protein EDD92_3123 [Streptomyces sp. TLI_185]